MRQIPPTSPDKLNNAEPAAPHINAAVSASAGTGKTYLLVTRIIRLLLEGVKPENILALTFTRKAAGEMRQRLHSRLQHFALLDDLPLDRALLSIDVEPSHEKRGLARNLYEQILFAERSLRISTFHAFCQDLLRRFPLEAGVPAGYELLEKTGTLETLAWDTLFLEVTRNPDTKLATSLETLFDICNGLDGTRSALLRAFLGHRSDWWAFTENHENPVTFACDYIRNFLEPANDSYGEIFSQSRLADLAEFRDLLVKHPTPTNLKHAADVERSLNPALDTTDRFNSVKQAFLTTQLEVRKRSYSQTLEKKLGGKGIDRLLQLHEQLSDAILETHDACLCNAAYALNTAWYSAGQALLNHYQCIKQEQRLLDFADLEWKSYRLLRDPEHSLWVQYKLDQKIDHMLIDEFQDTNPTQWQLILPLLQEIASGNRERPRSVFLVGDAKQSIYGFRRANPQLQLTASDWLQNELNGRIFPLSKSWRSSPVIIDCLNAIFSNTPLGNQLQNYEAHDTHCNGTWGRVELLPLIEPEKREDNPVENRLRDPLTEPRQQTDISAHYQEGLQIARRIHELMAENLRVERNDEQNTLNYQDIYILLRSRTHAVEYEQALQDSGIPFIGIEKGGLLDSLEIQDLEALLNVLITPFNNLGLAQVLRSPLFCASDQDLIQLAGCAEPASWYERLAKQESTALRRAYRLLSGWRELVGRLPVHDLLDRIYYEGDVLHRYRQATPSALQARVNANFNLLLEMALEIDSGRYPSLMRFLDGLKQLRGNTSDQPDTPPTAEENAKVRLMTIHAAKGLEAPVVFLADTAATRQPQDSYQALVDWPAEAPKPVHMLLLGNKTSVPHRVRQLCEQQQTLRDREQANLLYVALSRAKQILIVSGAASHRQSGAKSWYQEISEALSPLLTENIMGRRCMQTRPFPGPSSLAIPEVRPPEGPGFQIPNVPLPSRPGTGGDPVTPSTTATRGRSFDFKEDSKPEARQRGVIIHKLLELMSPPAPRLNPNLDSFLAYGITPDQLTKWRQEAIDVLQTKELKFLFDPECYLAAYNEIPVAYFTNDNQLIYGVIDRVVRLKNAVWVIDYKTQTGVHESNLPDFVRHYESQLKYYAEGVKQLWPDLTVNAALLLTSSARLIPLAT